IFPPQNGRAPEGFEREVLVLELDGGSRSVAVGICHERFIVERRSALAENAEFVTTRARKLFVLLEVGRRDEGLSEKLEAQLGGERPVQAYTRRQRPLVHLPEHVSLPIRRRGRRIVERIHPLSILKIPRELRIDRKIEVCRRFPLDRPADEIEVTAGRPAQSAL